MPHSERRGRSRSTSTASNSRGRGGSVSRSRRRQGGATDQPATTAGLAIATATATAAPAPGAMSPTADAGGPLSPLSPRFAEDTSPRILAASSSTGHQAATALSTPVMGASTPSTSAASRTPSLFNNKTGHGHAHGHAHGHGHGHGSNANPKRSPGSLQINTGVNAGPSTPTPILAKAAFTLPPPADQPEFAELLTPAQLRRRRRARAPAVGTVGGLPVLTGASRLGYTTGDGDLYRGAVADPTAAAADGQGQGQGPELDDEAVTLSSASSGSSSWSWGSNLEHGRRATMAVVHRFGEAIGVRRGSTSSSDSDPNTDSTSSISTESGEARSRIGRFSRALTRTMSRATNESSPERPRRVYVPRRREFTLYTPPANEEGRDGDKDRDKHASFVSLSSLPTSARAFPISDRLEPSVDPRTSDRVIITPVLPAVLEAVRHARLAAGVATPLPEPQPLGAHPRRHQHGHTHGHGHGKSKLGGSELAVRREKSAPAKQRQFVLPAIPRPAVAATRSQSRVEALRAGAPSLVRPKSASDLLGLSGLPSSSTTTFESDESSTSVPLMPSLTLTPSASPPLPATPATPPPTPKVRRHAAWWLDVSCPTWKDLRDIGELLSLHPLTLEDVLHQDPREKLDMYDKLGYYFIVVRALDEQYFKYTPGSSGPPGAELAAAAAGLPGGNGNGNGNGSGASSSNTLVVDSSPHIGVDPAAHHAKRKERTRRTWGFGRATGKAASKDGEKVEIVEDNPGKEGLEGVGVGGVNLYLVVFADGIVSFHYDDVSKHTRRVLERCLASHDDEATSDWISHGLLDSIIDAFFPLMGYVDGAVDDMDSLTIDPRTDPRTTAPSHATLSSGLDTMDPPYDQDAEDEKASAGASDDKDEWIELEKLGRAGKSTAVKKKGGHVGITGLQLRQRGGKASRALRKRKASFSRNIRGDNTFSPYPLSRGHILWDWSTKWMVIFLYLKLFFLPVTDARERLGHSVGGDKVVFDRSTMLKSITNMRRLVSGLSRLLGGKNAVVTSLLKRAHDSNAGGDDEAYLSDVHDHILLLQTSLYHYEYILSHCQPAYLSYLNVSSASARGGTDMLILALSTVSIGILPMQLVTGLFSMNVYRPSNGDQDEHLGADGKPAGFGWFAGIVVMVFVIACGLATIVRWWRWVARKKWTRRRGGKLPSEWAGFWGWD